MANGRKHAAASLVGSAILLPVGFLIFGPAGIFLSAGCASGVIITPDLDVSHPIYSDKIVERMGNRASSFFGQILRGAWRVIWMPYAWLIPHRSWISHAPLIGTIGRMVYLSLITLGFCGMLSSIISTAVFWLWLIGLGASDLFHWIMDL